MPHQCLKCGHLFDNGSTTILRGCPDCRGTRFFFTEHALGADERKTMLAGNELTLKEAIEQLVQKAKEGTLETEEGGWVLAGPPPTKVVADPEIVPKDLPTAAAALPMLVRHEIRREEQRVVVTLPVNKMRRGKKEGRQIRWDYEGPVTKPEPAPEPSDAPPLFATTGLKDPVPPAAPAAPAAAPAPVPAASRPVFERPPPAFDEPASNSQQRPETIRIGAPGEYEIDVKRLLEDSPVVVNKDGTYLIHLPSLFEAARSKAKAP